jgi:Sugar (and other) transporter
MRLANLREMSTGQWSIIRLIKSESLRWPLLLVCAMQAGQQLSGINAVSLFPSKISI